MEALRLSSLVKRYGRVSALRGLSLTVAEGEFVTLLGPSGCGKTTTLRCVAGLERPDGGEIEIAGRLVASAARGVFVPPNRRDLGMVFQSYALWPHMTVFGNVAYPLRIRRLPRREIGARVAEALASVGMAGYERRAVGELSGGQQQRVALARALIGQPRMLLLDEPLSNLDAKLRIALRKEIRAAHDRAATTTIYVTHDQAEAIALSDRVVVLHDGAIEQVGTPREIYRRPATPFVAEFVGFDNLLRARIEDVTDEAVAVTLCGSRGRLWVGNRPGGEDRLCRRGAPEPQRKSASRLAADRGAISEAISPLPPRGRLTRSARVLLAVRAEDIRLVDPAVLTSHPAGALAGRVLARAYAGESWEYTVAVGDEAVVLAREEQEGSPPRAPGDPVAVCFRADRAVLLDADSADRRQPDRAQYERRGLISPAPSPGRR